MRVCAVERAIAKVVDGDFLDFQVFLDFVFEEFSGKKEGKEGRRKYERFVLGPLVDVCNSRWVVGWWRERDQKVQKVSQIAKMRDRACSKRIFCVTAH